jgi:hypothetical protein
MALKINHRKWLLLEHKQQIGAGQEKESSISAKASIVGTVRP